MVDPTLLAIGAVAFFLVLILILRSGATEEPVKKDKQKQKQVQPKERKTKKGRGALKKNERSGLASEWHVVDSSKDASEVLEFLKGKDPNVIAKQHGGATKQATKKKGKKAKEEVQSSDDSASEDVSLEGFEQVKKKVPGDKKKKKKEKKQEDIKQVAPKPYFRPLNPDGTPIKQDEKPKKGDRKPKIQREGDAEGQAERKPRPEGERRERKPRPEGEQRENKGDGDNNDRKPREPRERPPKEPREVRRPITSPPNVKYEEADLNDILNSITQDFKASEAKPKPVRVSSIFSKIEREIVLKILAKLEARDLIKLAEVNHYFIGIARKDSLWKDLLAKDFGVKEYGKYRSFRAAYRAEYKKKHGRKGKKAEAAAPQPEEKDAKKNKKIQSSKEEVQVAQE